MKNSTRTRIDEKTIDAFLKANTFEKPMKKSYKILERTPWGQKGEFVIEEDIPLPEEQIAENKAAWEAEEVTRTAKREASDKWMENTLEQDSGGNFVYATEELIERYNELFPKESKMTGRKIQKIRFTYARTAKDSHKRGQRFVLAAGNKKRRQEYVVGVDGAWRKVASVG